MTYAIQEPVIRDVAPTGNAEISDLVADAMWDGPAARWLNVDPAMHGRETSMIPPPADCECRPKEAAGSAFDHDHCSRHGDDDCQAEIKLPDDGSPLWTIWRSPMP